MSRVLNGTNQITQGYNLNSHKGIDLVKWKNETSEILAHTSGVVVWVQTGQKNNKGSSGNLSYGNAVKIKHNNGYYTLYAHLKEVYVKKGDTVYQGQVIGYMGNTGNSYGIHLHFEVRNSNDVRINPTNYIDNDLPNKTPEIKYIYSVYDSVKNKWLPEVKSGNSSYAGNIGNSISAIKIKALTYKVHLNKTKEWLPWIVGDELFSGDMNENIDCIKIKDVTYRVHDRIKNKWLPWVTGDNSYAGNYGNDIDALQIK